MALLTTPNTVTSSLDRDRARRDARQKEVDAQVMGAFLRKEHGGADALHERYAARIYRLGLVVLRNRTDAEDLVQDTFLKVWRIGSAFDPVRGSLDGWILMIARGLAIDLLRRRTLEAKWLASEHPNSEASHEPGPERYAENRDSIHRAREAMNLLPPTQRTAVELAYLGDRSSTQVAKLEGIPVGTVKSRIRKGIATLRQILMAGESGDRATSGMMACAGCD